MRKDEKNVMAEKTEESCDEVKKSVDNDVATSTESGAEKKKTDGDDELVNTPYDDVYRTMINDASELILPVLNEIFGEHYTGTEKIVFTKDTHIMNRQDGRGQRRITDSSFAVIGHMTNYYLLELQSRPDSSLLIRFFEYGTQVALDEGELKGNVLKVRIPNCAVLFLRSTRNTPDQMEVQLETPGGEVIFPVLVMKVQRYTLNEIFEKQLYFLLPFYIFSHEKDFAEYEADEKKLELLKEEYVMLMSRLEALELDGHISAYNRSLIVELSGVVLSHIAAKYNKVKSEVKRIMGGRILDYEAKKIREDERRKFEEEKRKSDEQRIRNTVETVRNIMDEFKVTLDKAMSVANVAASDRDAVKAAITSA